MKTFVCVPSRKGIAHEYRKMIMGVAPLDKYLADAHPTSYGL